MTERSPSVEFLPVEAVNELYGAQTGHLSAPMQRIEKPRLLWLNRRAMAEDPRYHEMRGDAEAYARFILEAGAYVLARPEQSSSFTDNSPTTGFIDRYGGGSIGTNGGSGRSVFMNGFVLKGVGPTPLVSPLTPQTHASGGAYLEECVRESLYAEIVAAEFPHSAIATLAIIDTGACQVWDTPSGPKRETRALLVRPAFVRPAHFERAVAFISQNPTEGALDTARVRRFFSNTVNLWGRDGLQQLYAAFWPKWVWQLAYSRIHRMPHGANTTSNICLDGRLVDFGAMAALPSWARATTLPGRKYFGDEFDPLARAVALLAYYFGRYFDPQLGSPSTVKDLTSRLWIAYRHALAIEALRLCGVRRSRAEALDSQQLNAVWKVLDPLFSHFRRERLDAIEHTPTPRIAWDIPEVWGGNPGKHLRGMKALLNDLVPPAEQDESRQRCVFRARPRTNLYRDVAKNVIYDALESPFDGGHPLEQQIVSAFIDTSVVEARRDSRSEPIDATPVGFARGHECGHALFKCKRSKTFFSTLEWGNSMQDSAAKQAAAASEGEVRHPILTWSTDSIDFADGQRFSGAVAVTACGKAAGTC